MRCARRVFAILAALAFVAMATPAAGQPGRTPPGAAPPPPRPIQLTPEERDLLLQGEISPGQHIGGGLVSVMFGLGIGHAVQGRYTDLGWIFTVGEIGSGAAFVFGVLECAEGGDSGCSLAIAGALGMGVFRTWEVIDAFAAPPSHNRKVRALRRRLLAPQPGWYGFAAPTGDGAVAGLELRF